ncbi:MAG: hypothetical protein A2V87_00355 [Deltaproteobacteria bacterium RBG_16_58_17]|nr:MAG: hypothetical protein A2V87_00355 [Deltaproteobacteria bacterium RBG_16_58_17]
MNDTTSQSANSWLDVGYGADLQEFLLKQCHVKMVLDNQSRRSFASADVNTIIALFSPPAERRESGLERTARFVMFKVPFEQVLSPVVFEEIEATADRRATPEYRVFPIRQDRLLEDGCELLEDEETGADSFFYLTQKQVRDLAIEPEFLHPILVSSDQVAGFEIGQEDTDIVLVTTQKPKKELRGTRFIDYIHSGETECFPGRGGASIPAMRPSCKGHRPYWYSVSIPKPPPIYWMEMRRERYFTLFNRAALSADHTF